MERCQCSWIGKFNIVKMVILPKLIYRSNTIPIKIPIAYFAEMSKLTLICTWKCEGPWDSQTIFKKKNSWRTHTYRFQNCYKATVIKRMWYWNKNRYSPAWPDSAPPCLLRPSLFSCPFGPSFHHHRGGGLEGLTQATQDVSLFLKGDER